MFSLLKFSKLFIFLCFIVHISVFETIAKSANKISLESVECSSESESCEDDSELSYNTSTKKPGLKKDGFYYDYLGCYDAFEYSGNDKKDVDEFIHLNDENAIKSQCRDKAIGKNCSVFLVRGHWCYAFPLMFNYTSVDKENCVKKDIRYSIFAGKAYCLNKLKIGTSCNKKEVTEDFYKITTKCSYPLGEKNSGTGDGENCKIGCFDAANVTCGGEDLNNENIYLPFASPQKCVEFCSRNLTYYSGVGGNLESRGPKEVALLGYEYKKEGPEKDIFELPICCCKNWIDMSPVPLRKKSEKCNRRCPGDQTRSCGGSDKEDLESYNIYSSYTTGFVYKSIPETATPSTTQKSTLSTNTTTLSTTLSTKEASTTTIQSTETSTSTISIETSTATISTQASSTIKSTETPTTIESMTTEITTTSYHYPTTITEITGADTTAITKRTTTSPPPSSCSIKCVARDDYGASWGLCANTLGTQFCPRGTEGNYTWYCGLNGEFATQFPDFSQCHSKWVEDLKITIVEENKTVEDVVSEVHERLNKAISDPPDESSLYFGHEIKGILLIVQNAMLNQSLTDPVAEFTRFKDVVKNITTIGNIIVKNERPWEELSVSNKSLTTTQLFEMLEESAFKLLERALNSTQNQYDASFIEKLSPIKLVAGLRNKNETKEPLNFVESSLSSIVLPPQWKNYINGTPKFAGISINNTYASRILPGLNSSENTDGYKFLNGNLLSLSLINPLNKTIIKFSGTDGAEVKIMHTTMAWKQNNPNKKHIRRKLHEGEEPRAIYGSAICAFWDTNINAWSTEGCKLVKSGDFSTTCFCNHLTSFGVLMGRYTYIGKSTPLAILTIVLCALSVVCLFTTIVIYTTVSSMKSVRTSLTKNLAFCLLFGNILILIVTDRHYLNLPDGVCIAAGMLTHYVFLAAFMWMGLEGFHLYKMMVHVFDSGYSYMMLYRMLAYGLPIIVIIVTGLLGYFNENEWAYGGIEYCWLTKSYMWSFLGPVAVITSANLVVLFITMRTAYKSKAAPASLNQTDDWFTCYRIWVRGCFSITILLGLTWITGYFQLIDSGDSEIPAYIFTILNSSQGVLLFLYHCIMHEKVKNAAERQNIISWLSFGGMTSNDKNKNRSTPINSADMKYSSSSNTNPYKNPKFFNAPMPSYYQDCGKNKF